MKRPPSRRTVEKMRDREASVGMETDDAAVKWLEEHDPPPAPTTPKSAHKSKALHQFRQQQLKKGG